MKHMKKATVSLSVILAGLLSLMLCGCEASDDTESSELSASQEQVQTDRTNMSEAQPSDQSEAPVGTTAPPTTTAPADTTPPLVSGNDFEITQGESVSYKKQISISDDYDDSPTIEIDNSAVDIDKPGTYPVIYTVTDSAGNSTELTLNLTVKEFVPDKAATEEYVLYMARGILSEITDDSMSKLQVAYSIYRWSKYNIAYINTSNKSDWVIGAYDAFNKRQGDCFSYFAASKALLTAAGIDNFDLIRPRTYSNGSSHYWSLVNVGDGWYHFDSTPFVHNGANFFMLTDQEIRAWDSRYYWGEHTYTNKDVPELATKSIQSKVDYNSPKLKE